jgi:type I restriction enzyme, S subunit
LNIVQRVPSQSGWRRVSLGEVLTLINGRAYKQDELLEHGNPVVRIQNLNGGDRWYYSDLKLPDDKYCDNGDLLFAWSATFGPYFWNGSKAIYHYHIWKIVPSPSLDKNFAFYLLQSITERVKASGRGISMIHMTKAGMEAWEVGLPPLEEQRRIAAILDKADALRRKRKRALDLLNSLTQSIFMEMFGDERNSPFDIKVLDTIADRITDGAHFTPTYVDSGVPFLRVTDIQDEEINWQAVKYIPREEHDKLVLRCRPESGDVLLSKNGTIGIPRYVDWENIFSIFVSLCLIKPTKRILSGRYLTTYLKTPAAQRQLRQHAKTGTVTNLHLTEIRKMLIPLPPIEEQRKWEEMEATLRSRSKRQLRAFINSEALFSSLQSLAFSGQL